MDYNHPPTESLDIRHIVTGEQYCCSGTSTVFGHKRPNPPLHCYVETEGWFIEKQRLWPVQQCTDNLHLHALTERKITHRFAHQMVNFEQLNQLVVSDRLPAVAQTNRVPEGPTVTDCDYPSPA